MKIKFYSISLIITLFFLIGCKNKNKTGEYQGNNKKVLRNWAENIIIPSYKNYQSKVNQLVIDAKAFDKEKSEANLSQLKKSWYSSYDALQKVLIFDFGYAQQRYLIQMANTYPTDTKAIENNISLIENNKEKEIDFRPVDRVERQVFQGFPALDYLLFEKTHTLDYYKSEKGKSASTYIIRLTEVLQKNINVVVEDWEKGKDEYINDDDKSVSGSYAHTINTFTRVYEKEIRAMKVGYAAGAIKAQSGKPAPEIIEAYYNGTVSKKLLTSALQSSQDFFNGKHFTQNKEGESLKSILVQLKKSKLAKEINNRYTTMYNVIETTPKTLKETAITDNAQMRKIYNAIQYNVANYKTRMLADLKVPVGYVDTDGD